VRLIELHEEQAWRRRLPVLVATQDHDAARGVSGIEANIEERLRRMSCFAPEGLRGVLAAEPDCPTFRANRLLDTGVWQYPVLQYGVPDAVRVYGSASRHPEPGIVAVLGRPA
jgi:hypothetical protein